VQLPLALFGIAMSTALLPAVSSHLSKGNHQAAADDLKSGLAWLTWLTLPAVAGALLLAEPIIITLFEHGAFTHADSIATAHTLQAYAIGLIAFCWVRLLATPCYAGKDAKAPMQYAAISVAVNIVLALIFMQYWAYVGLALATSLAAFVNVALLFLRLQKNHGRLIDGRNLRRMLAAGLASILMLAALYGLQLLWGFPDAGKLLQAAWVAVAVAGGALAFFISAMALGERDLLKSLLKKRSKTV